jgi:hypothetical protein
VLLVLCLIPSLEPVLVGGLEQPPEFPARARESRLPQCHPRRGLGREAREGPFLPPSSRRFLRGTAATPRPPLNHRASPLALATGRSLLLPLPLVGLLVASNFFEAVHDNFYVAAFVTASVVLIVVALTGWATAELRRANAELGRANAELGRAKAEKNMFYARMMVISSSSSGDTSSGVDEARRGAPAPVIVSVDEFFTGFEAMEDETVRHLWRRCTTDLYTEWKAPTGATIDENRDIHPAVAAMLRALVPRWLRVWANFLAEDDIPCAEIRPDFTITHVCDAAVSVVGALLAVEVKLLGDLAAAITQTCAYLRRRVYKICCERDARGESCSEVFALGVATDGVNVVLVRVRSGAAPPPGGSFVDAQPCPVTCTAPLALFKGWDFLSKPDFRGAAPSAGFSAVARLMAAQLPLFGGGLPLQGLKAVITLSGGSSGAAATRICTLRRALTFRERVGCGGTSDVYELAEGVSSRVPAGTVVKVARSATVAVSRSYAAEQAALWALRGAATSGLVPELLGVGHRDPDAAWPLLLLRPRGKQLPEWVRECVVCTAGSRATAGSSGPPASAALALSVRRNCARIVAERLLEALEASHAADIVHCDVRPLNVVVVEGVPMLVDWGSSRRIGADTTCCGVAAYSSSDVFTEKLFKARPAQDIAGVLYTWLCVAFDGGCVAPWLFHSNRNDLEMFSARSAWIASRASSDATVAAIAKALLLLESGSKPASGINFSAIALAALQGCQAASSLP